MTEPLVFLETARMVVEAGPGGVPWDHSETGTPLSSEARAGWEPLPGPSLCLSLPVGGGLGGGCRAGGGGSSRETVTPRCFVNCFSQLVCSGLGLERHRMEV